VLDLAGDITEAAAQEGELEFRHIANGALHGMTFGWEERIPAPHGADSENPIPRWGEEVLKNCC
jgi:hypothetical protein